MCFIFLNLLINFFNSIFWFFLIWSHYHLFKIKFLFDDFLFYNFFLFRFFWLNLLFLNFLLVNFLFLFFDFLFLYWLLLNTFFFLGLFIFIFNFFRRFYFIIFLSFFHLHIFKSTRWSHGGSTFFFSFKCNNLYLWRIRCRKLWILFKNWGYRSVFLRSFLVSRHSFKFIIWFTILVIIKVLYLNRSRFLSVLS